MTALDAPGFGGSDDPPPTWTSADYGSHLGDILEALGVSGPPSWGCPSARCGPWHSIANGPMWPRPSSSLPPTAPADVVRLATTVMEELHPRGMGPALRALGAVDLRDVLATVTVPTLLVYGGADLRSPASSSARTYTPGSPDPAWSSSPAPTPRQPRTARGVQRGGTPVRPRAPVSAPPHRQRSRPGGPAFSSRELERASAVAGMSLSAPWAS